jgi:rubrerythrin
MTTVDPTVAKLAPLQQLRSLSCGYGPSGQTAPDRCPLCGGPPWAESPERVGSPP